MAMQKYMRAQEGILTYIAANKLPVGSSLPTEKQFSEKFGVSVLTLRRALSNLEKNKIITREHGRGTFVAAHFESFSSRGEILFISISAKEYGKISSPTAMEFTGASSELLSRCGYSCKLLTCGSRPSNEYLKEFKNASGIFITGYLNDEWLNFLTSLAKPLVVVGNTGYSDLPVTVIEQNWRTMTVMLGRYWLQKGFKKIGLITAGNNYAPSFGMREGYRYIMNTYGEGYDSSKVIFVEKDLGKEISDFLDRNPQLDTLLVERGLYTTVLECLWGRRQDMNIGILQDFVMQYDLPANVVYASFKESVWDCAADVMLKQMSAGEKPVENVKIDPVMHV